MINLFPYTDAHELNLDWVVEQVKANNTKVKDLTHTVENLHFDFDSKADKATTYTKSEVNTLLSTKANVTDLPDMTNYYDKSETNTLLASKADTSSLASVATSGSYNDLLNKPSFTEILNQKNIPSTATSYSCDWASYDFVLICALNVYNIMQEMTIPKIFLSVTSSGALVQFRDVQTNSTYKIYKDGNDHLYISSTNTNANLGLRIYGYK